MKKMLFLTLISIGIFSNTGLRAQTKIGYINTEELVAMMPEIPAAEQELKQFQADMQSYVDSLQNELSKADSSFVADSLKMSATQKTDAGKKLVVIYSKIRDISTQTETALQQKQESLLIPIRKKALELVRQIAKENGYTYILELNSVIIAPPTDDIMPLAKKKLGINK
ncbi:MAG: OmpH family outer membrane protein [Chitinophagaceae bacterium]